MENGRNKDVTEIYCGGLHKIMALIEHEMCINFAQLYLHNG